jgi:hypothetical protein
VTDRAAQVIEDFCLGLRDATMLDGVDASNEEKASRVRTVQLLHRSLGEGGFDPMPRVRQLSEETGWDMVEFLDQCLRFPAVVPRIRERDGIRRSLRLRRMSGARASRGRPSVLAVRRVPRVHAPRGVRTLTRASGTALKDLYAGGKMRARRR